MAKVTVSFSCDPALKKQATEIFSNIGLNMTSGLEVYLRAVVREGGIPFPLMSTDARPAVENRGEQYGN